MFVDDCVMPARSVAPAAVTLTELIDNRFSSDFSSLIPSGRRSAAVFVVETKCTDIIIQS